MIQMSWKGSREEAFLIKLVNNQLFSVAIFYIKKKPLDLKSPRKREPHFDCLWRGFSSFFSFWACIRVLSLPVLYLLFSYFPQQSIDVAITSWLIAVLMFACLVSGLSTMSIFTWNSMQLLKIPLLFWTLTMARSLNHLVVTCKKFYLKSSCHIVRESKWFKAGIHYPINWIQFIGKVEIG